MVILRIILLLISDTMPPLGEAVIKGPFYNYGDAGGVAHGGDKTRDHILRQQKEQALSELEVFAPSLFPSTISELLHQSVLQTSPRVSGSGDDFRFTYINASLPYEAIQDFRAADIVCIEDLKGSNRDELHVDLTASDDKDSTTVDIDWIRGEGTGSSLWIKLSTQERLNAPWLMKVQPDHDAVQLIDLRSGNEISDPPVSLAQINTPQFQERIVQMGLDDDLRFTKFQLQAGEKGPMITFEYERSEPGELPERATVTIPVIV